MNQLDAQLGPSTNSRRTGRHPSGSRYAFVHAPNGMPTSCTRASDAFLARNGAPSIPPNPRGDVIAAYRAQFEIPLHTRQLDTLGRMQPHQWLALSVVERRHLRHEFVADAVVKRVDASATRGRLALCSPAVAQRRRASHDHEEHSAFLRRSLRCQGTEAALACLKTVDSLQRVPAELGTPGGGSTGNCSSRSLERQLPTHPPQPGRFPAIDAGFEIWRVPVVLFSVLSPLIPLSAVPAALAQNEVTAAAAKRARCRGHRTVAWFTAR